MPPELALRPSRSGWAGEAPRAWRTPLLQLALAWAGLLVLTVRDWAEMAGQWWNASTYNHILLIPLVLAWPSMLAPLPTLVRREARREGRRDAA
jgi:hypothetical protein